MSKLLGAFLFLGAVFGGAFYFGSEQRALAQKDSSLSFQPTLYPTVNRSFAVVIIGRNNGAFVEKTLKSVFSQNYLEFRVFYIDNGSDDGSFDLARDLIRESGQEMRVTMLQNEEPLSLPANLNRVVDTCSDPEIIVVVKGEDWLAHEWVLSRLNQYYANPDLWLSFGQYRQYPDYSLGISQPLAEDQLIRHQPFNASHLQTFYAGLFRQIQTLDLLYSTEFAYMAPMLEMAKAHTAFIPEIFYIENRAAISQEDWDVAAAAEKSVRALKAYAPIDRIPL